MNGGQQCPFIPPYRAGDRIGPFRCDAIAAKVVLAFRGRKRDPAAGAEGGADEMNPFGAGRAKRERVASFQQCIAGDTTGWKNEVGDPGQDLVQGYIPLASAFRETVSSGTAICGASDQSLSRS